MPPLVTESMWLFTEWIMIKNKIFRNVSWIVGCRIVQAVINLVISMLTARYLGPDNYGLINYAASIVALAVPLMQLGVCNVLVHELVEHKNEEGKIMGTALTMTFASSLLTVLGVIAFSMIANKGINLFYLSFSFMCSTTLF